MKENLKTQCNSSASLSQLGLCVLMQSRSVGYYICNHVQYKSRQPSLLYTLCSSLSVVEVFS